MEKMFGSKMQGLFSHMSKEDKQNMMSRFERMAAMCPCMGGKEITGADKNKMMEKMRDCCGEMMEMMSACFKKTDTQSTQGGSSRKE